jgi:hypothetical protein
MLGPSPESEQIHLLAIKPYLFPPRTHQFKEMLKMRVVIVPQFPGHIVLMNASQSYRPVQSPGLQTPDSRHL